MDTGAQVQMAENNKPNIAANIAEYGKRLFGFIRGKVRSQEDAEDLLQDVWCQFSNLSNVEQLESVSGWLFKVARNRVTDYYRKKRTSSLEDQAFENEEGELNFKEIFLLDDKDPHLAQFKELFWEELTEALAELPENQRSVFVQNELEDMTLQQIADQSGENIKTIISRKGYATKHLRKRLEYLYNEFINS
ncbi:MAG: sigma-70 family RNA polymerase sigma factor [Bacteroidetes bacterium]|nr:sigma-70 family RNA polymerase sigma factor [Bacteroidota bacterium]